MDSSNADRRRLFALMAALEEPARAAELPADDGLVAVARHHRLSPLLSVTAGPKLPPALEVTFRRDRLITAARNVVLAGVAEECIRGLANDGVRTIVLKGLAYEQALYRAAGVRPTADVDLLVPNDKRRSAYAALDRLGFEPRASSPGFDDPNYHEVAWVRGGTEVDLHLALVPFVRCGIDYEELWRLAQPFLLGRTEALVLHPVHAAVFHALHMAVDHFDVPGVYLVDLSKLIAAVPEGAGAVVAKARAWRCHRPLATALALTGAFLPRWRQTLPIEIESPAPRVVAHYGPTTRVTRPEQLLRKFIHFDSFGDAIRYFAVQSRRNVRERIERHIRKRSARERLSLAR